VPARGLRCPRGVKENVGRRREGVGWKLGSSAVMVAWRRAQGGRDDRRTRGGSAALNRRAHACFIVKGSMKIGRSTAVTSAGAHAQGGSGGPAGSAVRGWAASAGVPRGGGGRPEGCGAQTGSRACLGMRVRRRRRVAALWSAGRGGARDVAHSGTTRFGASHFHHVFL
jgi:hypothetical protein